MSSSSSAGADRAPLAELRVGEHQVALLRDGGQAFPAMLAAIASARSFVCLETYILRDDGTGLRFGAALAERARSGVEVSVLYDAWGSRVSPEFLAALGEAGVRTVSYHPLSFAGPLARILSRTFRRDHRKGLVVDGRVAFTGGMNIADDYAAPEDGGQGWRDTAVRLEGPAVQELLHLFLTVWRRAKGAPLDEHRYVHRARRPDPRVRVIGSGGPGLSWRIRRAYVEALREARARVRITSAYFLPTRAVSRALRDAALRGVDVQVIAAGTTDVPAVRLAARDAYARLLRAGVRIFEWRGRVLHAKTAVVDGSWCTVGSANLDTLSLQVNLEVNAVLEDAGLGAAMEGMFADDLTSCEEVTLGQWEKRPLLERLISWVAARFRRWL
jgi:cardiolipin synthase